MSVATSLYCTATSYTKTRKGRKAYAKYKLKGTVFSGASNKTTLQNTLRTGVYAMVYIRQAAD